MAFDLFAIASKIAAACRSGDLSYLGCSNTGHMEREEVVRRFNNYISSKTLEGFVIVDKNDSGLTVVLKREAEKVNHTLHAILTLVTCVWGIVWIIKVSQAKKEIRIRASFDSNGNLVEEKVGG